MQGLTVWAAPSLAMTLHSCVAEAGPSRAPDAVSAVLLTAAAYVVRSFPTSVEERKMHRGTSVLAQLLGAMRPQRLA